MTLTDWLNESVKQSAKLGYYPSYFQRMRVTHGDVETVRRLVESGEMQRGFVKLFRLGKLDLTVEHAVGLFPAQFNRVTQEWARARIEAVKLGMTA